MSRAAPYRLHVGWLGSDGEMSLSSFVGELAGHFHLGIGMQKERSLREESASSTLEPLTQMSRVSFSRTTRNMVPSTGRIHVFMILFWFSMNFLYGFPATWLQV